MMQRASFLIACFLYFIHNTACVLVVRDDDAVNYQHFQSLKDFSQRFVTLDHNIAFAENVLVGVATNECMGMLMAPAFLGAQRAASSAITVATIPQEEFPLELDRCAEVLLYKYNSTILSPSERTTVLDHTELTNWIQQMIRVEVQFINLFEFPIVIYWHSDIENEQGVRTAELEAGMSGTIITYLGHIFSAHKFTREGEGELVDWMSVVEPIYTWRASNRLHTCEIVPGAQAQFVNTEQLTCNNLELRFAEFKYRVYYAKRIGLNYVQPKLVRAVTRNGFALERLPSPTYKWLKEWYTNNKDNRSVPEVWLGPCMNQHVAPSIMTHLPDNLKQRLSTEIAPLLETWYGGKLNLTSVYGIRKYTNGAILRMHVDTVHTHVVSAIINVDQNVEEDWPLLILDHEGVEHSLLMRPGDMIFYESAKLLHGRPIPLKGSHYDNIFIHFRPARAWNYDWM